MNNHINKNKKVKVGIKADKIEKYIETVNKYGKPDFKKVLVNNK